MVPMMTGKHQNHKSPSWLKRSLNAIYSQLGAKLITAIASAIIGIPALVYWAFGAPSFPEIWRLLESRFVEPARDTDFAVLVTDLDGDSGLKQTTLLAEALEENVGLQIIRIGGTLVTKTVGEVGENRRQVERTGQKWLDQHNGDLLIWGKDTGAILKIYFVTRDRSGLQPEGYERFGKGINLPRNFDEDIRTQLIAVALSAIAPATKEQGTYLVTALRPVATKIRAILEKRGDSFSPEQRGRLNSALGLAALAIGEQAGEQEWLERATMAFSSALEQSDRERMPLDWAAAQSNLGNVLFTLGRRRSDTAKLKKAEEAYSAALKEYEKFRSRVPIRWAMTQNNLGIVLSTLGWRENGTANLKKAEEAHRTALKEYSRTEEPLKWASTQSNLGDALQRLGIREKDLGQLESGTAKLKEAKEAYSAALKEFERFRSRVPLRLAITQNNLGVLLEILGTLEESTDRLNEAVIVLRAALEVRTQERVPLQWAMTQNNLGTALHSLGKRESGTVRLKEAEEAYREALREYTRTRTAFNWAQTNHGLALTLEDIAVREQEPTLMKEAIERIRKAERVYGDEGRNHWLADAQRSVARMEAAFKKMN